MKTDSELPVSVPRSSQPLRQRFLSRPNTRLGWWSFGLGATFVVLWINNTFVFMPTTVSVPWRQIVLPFYGIFIMLCGFVAGIVGLIAVIRWHDLSWLVWLTFLPWLFVLALVSGEFLVPH